MGVHDDIWCHDMPLSHDVNMVTNSTCAYDNRCDIHLRESF
jgi:hypothetical protein